MENRRWKYWTPSEEELLREYYPKYTHKKIAELLGRNSASIIYKVEKMNLKLKKFNCNYDECNRYKIWTNEDVKQLFKLYHEGCRLSWIAKELKRSKESIKQKIWTESNK